MNKTKIEYMTHSWNPIAMRCTPCSDGCKYCWHLDINKRFNFHSGPPKLREKELEAPSKLKEPAIIGTQFMGDLFHKDIPTRHIQSVFDVIKKCPQHTFLILTKRIEEFWNQRAYFLQGPLPENMWLGVTIEHPKYGYRADYLRRIPAAVRFLSLEPLLADFSEYPGVLDDMNWCIIGSESGPNARPMKEDWVRKVVAQCKSAKIPVFYKQKLEGKKKISLPFLDGKQYAEYPTPGH